MANRRSGKLWTPGLLKSRGWTKELMAQLLPRPQYRRFNGRSVPIGTGTMSGPQRPPRPFRPNPGGPAPGADLQAAAAAAQAAAALFGPGLAGRPQGGNLALGAGRILSPGHCLPPPRCRPGPGAAVQSDFRLSQPISLLGTRCDEAQLPGVLTHFVQAGVWLGDHPDAPLAGLVKAQYPGVLRAAAEQVIVSFTAAQPEADLPALLQMKDFPVSQLLSRTLGYLYSVCYVPQAIRTSLEVLMALNPKDEYPEARAMDRHFILHLGGTNTGKTYAGFQRLKQARTGVYLAPLRLLALEAQEVLLDAGIDCSLTTGEEEDRRAGDTHVAATAEKAGPETALRGGCDRRVSNDRRPAAGLCLDPGHSGGPGARGPPLRRPGGQGPSPAHHRQLWRQL